MGAMQAQDYGMAKLAVALRMTQAHAEAVEKAFASGEILRTHVLRPTWHFVSPQDIRWMLALSGPRIIASMRSQDRLLGLDEKTFDASGRVLEEALKNGESLTKEEIASLLEEAGIKTGAYRIRHFLMRAELEALICSGKPRGKKQTWALLASRAAAAKVYGREEAAGLLARRYFSGRGPATALDFAWWSGLPVGEAKKAAESLPGAGFSVEEAFGMRYFFLSCLKDSVPEKKASAKDAFLLPAFDEYLISYRDRRRVIPRGYAEVVSSNGIFHPVILYGAVVAGTWKRKGKNEIILSFFEKPGKNLMRAAHRARETLIGAL
jgi:hypothetical protein